VTKKIRYRFIGVGNGRYTIELVKQSILSRVREKLERCRQLAHVFSELQDDLGLRLGKVTASLGDARSISTWPIREGLGAILTSPPYLPASSGREHYGASRALAFAVLGYDAGAHGYHNVGTETLESLPPLEAYPEAEKLLQYLISDASEDADPQKDAMRFMRKAVPTHEYINEMVSFLENAQSVLSPAGVAMMVVANQHTFYSHRRQEIEHVVSGVALYGEMAQGAGFLMKEDISMELLKASTSRARPRAMDDYFESVLILSHEDGARIERQAANRA
jgi:hypothetical protein